VPEQTRPDLPPHYYRDNFLHLCRTVEARYGDLLSPGERALLERFSRATFAAQCLYVRLISRVGPWFRTDRLDYPEIDDMPGALLTLEEIGLLLEADALPVEELGRLYTREEIHAAFAGELAVAATSGKPVLLAAMAELAPDPAQATHRLLQIHGGRLVAPAGGDDVQVLQLLFFGNRRQSLTEFVLSDLGILRFYLYDLDIETRLFSNREALEEYLACAGLSDRYRELLEATDTAVEQAAVEQAAVEQAAVEQAAGLEDLAREMAAFSPQYASSLPRWYRQCNNLGRELERRGREDLAEQLYIGSARHPARERRARILERRGDWSTASALCEEILADPWCEEEAEAAGRILPRVRRKLGGDPVRRRRETFPRIDLCLPRQPARVEEMAAAALRAHWASVDYVENVLMNALFGLAFWEQIFAPVPGVFHNPFQSLPSDMYEGDFHQRRQASIANRLAELESLDLERELVAAYRRYHPCQCRWVNWRLLEEAQVQRASSVIPASHLLTIWRRMLFDPRENRRGFPDLLALGDGAGDYCLIEVKGPGDALQDNQRRWLRFFLDQGIPATVAWVEWSDD
jgi:hypothetical protein